MGKCKSEPKLWIAEVTAIRLSDQKWYSCAVTSYSAHITRKAGLSDIEDAMYETFKRREYDRHEIVSCFGIRWSDLQIMFSDYIGNDDDDDDSDNPPAPPIEPIPDGEFVPEVSQFICNFIDGLNL
jgi:hypothetical protein